MNHWFKKARQNALCSAEVAKHCEDSARCSAKQAQEWLDGIILGVSINQEEWERAGSTVLSDLVADAEIPVHEIETRWELWKRLSRGRSEKPAAGTPTAQS